MGAYVGAAISPDRSRPSDQTWDGAQGSTEELDSEVAAGRSLMRARNEQKYYEYFIRLLCHWYSDGKSSSLYRTKRWNITFNHLKVRPPSTLRSSSAFASHLRSRIDDESVDDIWNWHFYIIWICLLKTLFLWVPLLWRLPPFGLLLFGFQEKESYDNNSRSTFILCSYFNKRKFMQRVESLMKILVQRFQRFQKD